MDRKPKVLFYGNSLVLAGVQVSFKCISEVDVIALNRPVTKKELLAFDPIMIVFDTRALEPEFHNAQLQDLPGVLLIGFDPESHEVLLTGQAVRSISLEQIMQIMRNLIGPRVVDPVYRPAPST